MANEALNYFRVKVYDSKKAGRIRFDVNKKRLQKFKARDVSDAIDILVNEGFFIADHMTTTYWHNEDMGSESTYLLRIEWDNDK